MSSFEYRSRRLILRSPRTAEEQVARYAAENGWPKVEETSDDPDRGTLREVVWRIASGAELHYTVDDATGCPYVFVTASWRNLGRGFLEHAEQHLDVLSREELFASYDNATDPEERAGVLLLLALGSPQEFDQEGFERISAALRDPDPVIREAAIYATSYTPSRHYRPLLEEIARRDPVGQLRRDAQDMLDAYDEAGIGEP